jgi:putative ABC transport system permease protein
VALAFVLLVGAGLLVRSFRSLAAVDPGFRPDHVLTFNLGHPDRFHGAEQVAGFYDRLVDRLEAIPGVTAAGAVNGLPLAGGGGLAGPIIREFPPAPGEPAPLFHIRLVTPGYFRTLGIPAVEGRLLNAAAAAASVVISHAVKRSYWPGCWSRGCGSRPSASSPDWWGPPGSGACWRRCCTGWGRWTR